MREILRAVVKRKPILAMLEPEREKGGLTQDEIFREVHEADTTCEKAGKWYSSKYVLWGLDAEVKDWGYHMPDGSDICNEVFESDPIEWNRIGAFQVQFESRFHRASSGTEVDTRRSNPARM
jgi:hypothetical protein